jgi:hypothetical protein
LAWLFTDWNKYGQYHPSKQYLLHVGTDRFDPKGKQNRNRVRRSEMPGTSREAWERWVHDHCEFLPGEMYQRAIGMGHFLHRGGNSAPNDAGKERNTYDNHPDASSDLDPNAHQVEVGNSTTSAMNAEFYFRGSVDGCRDEASAVVRMRMVKLIRAALKWHRRAVAERIAAAAGVRQANSRQHRDSHPSSETSPGLGKRQRRPYMPFKPHYSRMEKGGVAFKASGFQQPRGRSAKPYSRTPTPEKFSLIPDMEKTAANDAPPEEYREEEWKPNPGLKPTRCRGFAQRAHQDATPKFHARAFPGNGDGNRPRPQAYVPKPEASTKKKQAEQPEKTSSPPPSPQDPVHDEQTFKICQRIQFSCSKSTTRSGARSARKTPTSLSLVPDSRWTLSSPNLGKPMGNNTPTSASNVSRSLLFRSSSFNNGIGPHS